MTADSVSRAASDRLSGNLLAAAAMAIWAAGFPAADGLLDTWEPLAVVVGRFVMALLLLVPLWLLLEGRPRGVAWGSGLWVGALGFGGGAVLIILAQAATDPVTVAVISACSPLTGTVVEWVSDRKPLTGGFLLGLAASVLGGVVATWGGGGGQGNLLLGVGLAVLSCLLYSWASHETVRRLPGLSGLGQATITSTGAFGGVVLTWVLAFAAGYPALPAASVTMEDLGLLAIYGGAAVGLSQILWIQSVRRLGVAVASFHINLAPFYVMVILLALGGDWSWMQALGAAIVAGGVLLAQR
ncbi:DMT family transporter [Rubellimicrobium rubrum]|nr:DMT family transporter [Rubellimicrobium rubrum]